MTYWRTVGLASILGVLWLAPMVGAFAAAQVSQRVLPDSFYPPGYEQQLALVQEKTEEIKAKNKEAKRRLDELRAEKEKLQGTLEPDTTDVKMLGGAFLEVALAKANLDGAEIAVTEAQQIIDASTVKISSLENELRNTTFSPVKPNLKRDYLSNLQIQLNYQRALKKAQQAQADDLQRSFDLAKQVLEVQRNWRSYLESLYQVKRQQQQREEFQQKEDELRLKHEYWENQLGDINRQINALDKSTIESTERGRLQISIFEAQEKSNLAHLELVLARLSNQSRFITRLDQELTVTEYNAYIHQANVLAVEVQALKDLIGRKLTLIKFRQDLILQSQKQKAMSSSEFKQGSDLLHDLLQSYQAEAKKVDKLGEQITLAQMRLQKDLNHALSRRQGLPDLSLEAWSTLIYRLMLMPGLAVEAGHAIWGQGKLAFTHLNYWQVSSLFLLELCVLLGWYYLRKALTLVVNKIAQSKQSFADNILFLIFELLRRNITTTMVFLGLIFLCWFSGMPFKSFLPLVYLGLIWLAFKLALGFARLTLVESTSNALGHDVKLYQHLRWAFVGGCVLTMLTVLAHQLPVVYEVRDFFSRLFMLFLLVVAILLLRNWQVVPRLLAAYVDGARPYFMRVVRLLSFLIPLALLIMALIGFLGYVDLAWTMSKYAGIFLMVLTGYVLARGFLVDLTAWLSELFIRRLRNGWLWNQAILRPLDKLLRLALLFFAFFTLFMLYGWGSTSFVVSKIKAFLDFHLVAVEGITITPMGIFELIVAGMVLFWVARWTREFSYRWLFARSHDLGLRNSLSTLTQYTVVFFGILITLKVVGIDFTAISYILTALAFGIGFGLRDLAKNYVSGFLLLLERPVRVGDVISIGGCEGEVSHVGTRSMTVKTWDNMEVLVPNSDLFEKQVTNWTFQDPVVRTVFMIKVKREDAPTKVQELILTVLKKNHDILTEPESQVLLKEIADTYLEFEVRYFTNLQLNNSRATVRSGVLLALWQCFSENDIQAPHIQQDIYVKSVPE